MLQIVGGIRLVTLPNTFTFPIILQKNITFLYSSIPHTIHKNNHLFSTLFVKMIILFRERLDHHSY